MPRNVIILHTDQQRADSLGCMGNPYVRTPNLDRLAQQGTICRRHIVSNPICSPSRASLLTGLYPPGHNVWCNGVPLNRKEYVDVDSRCERMGCDCQEGFHPQPTTMADMFASAGYDTASFGKLHLTPYMGPKSYGHQENEDLWRDGVFDDWHGPYYGFRHVDMLVGHGEGPCWLGPYSHWLKQQHPQAWNDLAQQQPRPIERFGDLYVSSLPLEAHHSIWLAERLNSYLTSERPKGQPFFAFVGFPDPHHPFTPCRDVMPDFTDIEVQQPGDPQCRGTANSPVDDLNQEQLGHIDDEELRTVIRHTYAMVYQIDVAVGRILDTLEATGLADDTIVVFTSDHGDFLGDHNRLRKGIAASNSLLNVPLLISAPGSDLPTEINTPVSNCDVLPTLSSLTGVSAPENVHGTSLCDNQTGEYAMAFSSNGAPRSVNATIYDQDHRLTWYPHVPYVELFDHRQDATESNNVADAPPYRDHAARLKQILAERMATFTNPILNRISAW